MTPLPFPLPAILSLAEGEEEHPPPLPENDAKGGEKTLIRPEYTLITGLSTLKQARGALIARQKEKNPVLLSLLLEKEGLLACGSRPEAAAVLLQSMGAAAVGFECPADPAAAAEALADSRRFAHIPLMAHTGENPGKDFLFSQREASIFLTPGKDSAEAAWAALKDFTPLPLFPALEEDPAAVAGGQVFFIEPTVTLSEDLAVTPAFPQQVLEAENEPWGALKIWIGTEEELLIFDEYQYMLTLPVCLCSRSPELFARAVAAYCGRALYDGACEIPDKLVARLSARYGLIVL